MEATEAKIKWKKLLLSKVPTSQEKKQSSLGMAETRTAGIRFRDRGQAGPLNHYMKYQKDLYKIKKIKTVNNKMAINTYLPII